MSETPCGPGPNPPHSPLRRSDRRPRSGLGERPGSFQLTGLVDTGADWHSDGLVLLGSVGFLDRFTVTASRFAQAIAIEDSDAFDDRFGVVNGP